MNTKVIITVILNMGWKGSLIPGSDDICPAVIVLAVASLETNDLQKMTCQLWYVKSISNSSSISYIKSTDFDVWPTPL